MKKNYRFKIRKLLVVLTVILGTSYFIYPKDSYATSNKTEKNSSVDYIINNNDNDKIVIDGKYLIEWIMYNKGGGWSSGEINSITMNIINNSIYEYEIADFFCEYDDNTDMLSKEYYTFEPFEEYISDQKQTWRISNKILGYLYYGEYETFPLTKEQLNNVQNQISIKSEEIQRIGEKEQEINTYSDYILYYYNYIYENRPENPITKLDEMDTYFISELFNSDIESICVEEEDINLINLGKKFFYEYILKFQFRKSSSGSDIIEPIFGYWDDKQSWQKQLGECLGVITTGETSIDFTIGTDENNMGNSYLGTSFLKGLKFEIVLEKIIPTFNYTIEYYKDKATTKDDEEHIVHIKQVALNKGTHLQTENPGDKHNYIDLNEYRPNGYNEGEIESGSLIVDKDNSVIKILYTKLYEDNLSSDKDDTLNDSNFKPELEDLVEEEYKHKNDTNLENQNTEILNDKNLNIVLIILLVFIAYKGVNMVTNIK